VRFFGAGAAVGRTKLAKENKFHSDSRNPDRNCRTIFTGDRNCPTDDGQFLLDGQTKQKKTFSREGYGGRLSISK
jgi:hypothetical protein